MDIAAGSNELLVSMGFTSPLPWLNLQQVSLILGDADRRSPSARWWPRSATKRLRAQEAAIEFLGKYEAVYRTVPIGLISFGPEDRVERFNDGFARMFGLPFAPRPRQRRNDRAMPARRHAGRSTRYFRSPCAIASAAEFTAWASATSLIVWATRPRAAGCEYWRAARRLVRSQRHRHHRPQEHRTPPRPRRRTRRTHRRAQSSWVGPPDQRILESGDDITQLSLVYLDLDRFKLLNDLFGHQAGDTVLQEVVSRLQSALGEEFAVARLGGDEFAALLDPTAASSTRNWQRVPCRPSPASPSRSRPGAFTVTASVGMFRFAPGLSQEALIAGADRACLDAKRKGRNQVVIQNDASALIMRQMAELSVLADLGDSNTLRRVRTDDPADHLAARSAPDRRRSPACAIAPRTAACGRRRTLLDAADERGEMAKRRPLDTAPVPALARAATASASAARLPVAEPVGHFPERRVLQDLRAGPAAQASPRRPSRRHRDHRRRSRCRTCSSWRSSSPSCARPAPGIALDDFGSGYSSFASLNDVGASYLKIDGKFVEALSAQAPSTTVIRTITVLAHELGMECIAVSVEDADTLGLLKTMGADYGQGGALCPPLPLAGIRSALRRRPTSITRRKSVAPSATAPNSARGAGRLPVPVAR